MYILQFLNYCVHQNKKDVTITYTLKTSTDAETVQFDDVVEYRSASAPASSAPSRVVGVDTLIASAHPNPSGGASAPQPSASTLGSALRAARMGTDVL